MLAIALLLLAGVEDLVSALRTTDAIAGSIHHGIVELARTRELECRGVAHCFAILKRQLCA